MYLFEFEENIDILESEMKMEPISRSEIDNVY